ncbi:hypothetical protein EV426DRAFT_578110 [Tirmania nivea]|nr:hypothetical protein EV426DRAFT_578110 [Tirmania nivea]
MLCCASRRKPRPDPEAAPLLQEIQPPPVPPPHPKTATPLQHSLHKPLHIYLILRALRRGYLPSTEQFVGWLEKLAAVFGKLEGRDGKSGEEGEESQDVEIFIDAMSVWVKSLGAVLREKLAGDELQKGIWLWRMEMLTGRVGGTGAGGWGSREGWAAVKALVGIAMRVEEFRGLVEEVAGVVREAVGEGLVRGGEEAMKRGGELKPGGDRVEGDLLVEEEVEVEREDTSTSINTTIIATGRENLAETAIDATKIVADSVATATGSAGEQIKNNISSEDTSSGRRIRARLVRLLRELIVKTEEPNAGRSFLRMYLVEWVKIWLRGYLGLGSSDARKGVPEYVRLVGIVVGRCGSEEEWVELGKRWRVLVEKVMDGRRRAGLGGTDGNGKGVAVGEDVDEVVLGGMVEKMVDEVAGLIENYHRGSDQEEEEEKEKNGGDDQDSFLMQLRTALRDTLVHPIIPRDGSQDRSNNLSREDVSLQFSLEDFLSQIHNVFLSILHDSTLVNFLNATTSLLSLNPEQAVLQRLVGYGYALLPKLLSRLPCVPIPRLEILSPSVDLLMENLIVTPIPDGSSLLPSRVQIKTNTNLNLTDTNPNAVSTTITTVYIGNLTPLTAQRVGYILRLHLTRFLPTITSRGLISLTLPKGISFVVTHNPFPPKNSPKIKVRVTIPELTYSVVDSTGCGGVMTIFRPLLSPIIRALAEARIEEVIAEVVEDLEKEISLAKERVRGIKAVGLTGWGEVVRAVWVGLGESVFGGAGAGADSDGGGEDDADDDDVEISLGISAARRNTKSKPKGDGKERKGWEGVYAPGSVVGLWEEEQRREREKKLQMYRERWWDEGWRSEVFGL